MTVDLAARAARITVNGLDVSPLLDSLVIRYNQWNRSGVASWTGTLTLDAYVDGFAESTDPRVNPQRWALGNAITVELLYQQWVQLPLVLRITKTPRTPHPGNPKLQIPVGDDLTLLNYRAPQGDVSGVQLGTSTDRDQIINSVLAAAGAPALVDQVQQYPLDYPLQKLDSGGYISFGGQVAYTANQVLYQDNTGVRAQPITMDGLQPRAVYFVGSTEADYFPVDNDEGPPQVITVCGAKTVVVDNDDVDLPPQITIVPRQQLFPDSSAGGNVVAQRVELKIINKSSEEPIIRETKREPKGVLLPDDFPNDIGLIDSLVTFTRRRFDSSGRLAQQRIDYRQPAGVVLGSDDDFAGSTSSFDSKRETITYQYNSDDTISSITTITKDPAILVDPERYLNDLPQVKRQLIDSQKKVQAWTSVGSTGNYLYTEEIVDYRVINGGGNTSSSSEYSSSGQSQPPATEWQEDTHTTTEQQVCGQATFEAIAGDDFREQPDPIVLNFGAVSNQQCSDIAQVEGAIRHGRQYGITWAADLTEDWLSNLQPHQRIDFVLGGVQTAYLTDSISLSMQKRSFSIGGDGIEIGRVGTGALTPVDTGVKAPAANVIPAGAQQPPAAVNQIAPPFKITNNLIGGLRVGGTLQWYTYQLQPVTNNLIGGLRVGGVIDADTPTQAPPNTSQICWSDIDQAQWFGITESQWFAIANGCIAGTGGESLTWPTITTQQWLGITQSQWFEVSQ